MRTLLWKIVRWFLFKLDAETAHRVAIRLIKVGIFLRGVPLRTASGVGRNHVSECTVFDMQFCSRVGLAAGFDKDAEILEGLPALGFGFAEIGTVTPRPQPGNNRPRLFRDTARQALFNRMGFNGLGAEIVSKRLAKAREKLPVNFRVGVNIGKNKDTPLEQSADDYVKAVSAFDGLADFIVINVSSPNTPGLRSLQTVQALQPIVERVGNVISGWSRRPPLLLKLAPELQVEELAHLMRECERWGINGWVLTNTLGGERSGGLRESLSGGWSGGPLTSLSRQVLVEARRLTKLPIISVGGIMTAEEALKRIECGADLVQLYSGWVYGGPSLPAELASRIG